MRLYLLHGCPFAHRAAMALREKDLKFELAFFEVGTRPKELEELGPIAKSPTLFDGDTKVYDSHVVLEYLEDRYPERPLMPESAQGRAQVRLFAARVRDEFGPKNGALVIEALKPKPDEAKLAEAKRGILDQLASWDALLQGRSFAIGDALTLADITLYTFFPSLRRFAGFEVPEERPNLRAWLDRIASRPSAAVPHPS